MRIHGSVNSGELVVLRRAGRSILAYPVEASAASHVAPVYACAGEAPRIYGEYDRLDALVAWHEWALSLLGVTPPTEWTRTSRLRAAKQLLRLHAHRIPQE